MSMEIYDVDKAAEDYIKAFGRPLPIDYSIRLKNPNSEKEYVETIYKAIAKNIPFEDEGVF